MLRTIAIAWSIVLLGIGGVLVAEYPLSKEFGAGAVGYGLLTAAWGGGSPGNDAIADPAPKRNRSASTSAIARPMPRDAPVTIAT